MGFNAFGYPLYDPDERNRGGAADSPLAVSGGDGLDQFCLRPELVIYVVHGRKEDEKHEVRIEGKES